MITEDMSDIEYHAHEFIGSSTAVQMLESSQLFHDCMNGVVQREDKPHFKIGRIAHMMVLEPDRFDQQITTEGPINPKTGKMYGRGTKKFEEWEAQNPGMMVVEPWLYTMLERMPPEVREIYDAQGVAELSIFEDIKNVGVKCRPDWLMPDHIYDLKTIDDINHIEKHIKTLRYWFTSGWYRRVMQMSTGVLNKHTFIFVEKKPPFRWRIVDLNANDLSYGYDQACEVMAEIDTCFGLDDFSDYEPIHVCPDLYIHARDKKTA